MSSRTGKSGEANEKGGSSQNSFNAFDISCLRPHFNVAEKCNFLRRRWRRRCRRHFCHGPIKMMHNFIGFISVKIETRDWWQQWSLLSSPSAIAHTPRYAKCVYIYEHGCVCCINWKTWNSFASTAHSLLLFCLIAYNNFYYWTSQVRRLSNGSAIGNWQLATGKWHPFVCCCRPFYYTS